MRTRAIVRVEGAAFDAEGRVLLAKRRDDVSRPGLWEFPGGKVERGEAHAAALTREWWEETGANIVVVRRIAHTVFDLEVSFQVTLFLVTLRPGAEPRPLESDDVRWVDPTWAVVNLGCAPSVYVFYPHLLASRRRP